MTETKNFREIELSLITPHLRSRGEADISIRDSYLDELAHNTIDYGGSELGVIVTQTNVQWGNDSNPMGWDDLYNKFIESIIPIHDNTRTGYWGAGVSKIFVYKHGLLEYQCSLENGKYFYRLFTYDGLEDSLTFESLNSVKNTLKISLQEYEVSEDEYRKLTHSDKFDNLPTFFISIRRWDDCNLGMKHKPDKIIIIN